MTRLKENASFVVVKSRAISDNNCKRADEIIVFAKQAAAGADRFLPRVVWWDEQSQREFV
ncbi:MAG: hypothetical protein K7J46_19370 [Bryobacter sp.]|nr:hypothetical protein [Bryobacter sp. CoA8 C33]